MLATILVGQREAFSVRLESAALIAIAERLQRDEGGPQIPLGTIVRSPSPDNPGYGWHLDPATFTFAPAPPVQDCVGMPSDIEGGPLATAGRFCPLDSMVVRLSPVR